MNAGVKVGIGVGIGAAALVGGAVIAATRSAQQPGHAKEARAIAPGAGTSPGDDPVGGGTSPGDDPLGYPGGGTSPGDEPISMPVRGLVDPPGWWNDHPIDGHLRRDQLDAKVDPPGWGNDVRMTGRVDHGGWQTTVDPPGFLNTTDVRGRRTSTGYSGTVDRPGPFNEVDHVIRETIRGADVVREGRFDELLVPSFSEVTWRSQPSGRGVEGRTLEFDPPGWGNTTRVTLESNVPAGVEATIAAYLYDRWATERERVEDYPDPDYPDPWPGGTSPGDGGYPPTAPGDGGWYDPGYPDDYPI